MAQLECLGDCDAFCCKPQPDADLVYNFTDDEARMLAANGAELYRYDLGGYFMPNGCPLLHGKICIVHNLPTQPKCCIDNKPGGKLCLQILELHKR
jgi:hypothetical protein